MFLNASEITLLCYPRLCFTHFWAIDCKMSQYESPEFCWVCSLRSSLSNWSFLSFRSLFSEIEKGWKLPRGMVKWPARKYPHATPSWYKNNESYHFLVSSLQKLTNNFDVQCSIFSNTEVFRHIASFWKSELFHLLKNLNKGDWSGN